VATAAKAASQQATAIELQADPILPSKRRSPRVRRRSEPASDIFDTEVLPLRLKSSPASAGRVRSFEEASGADYPDLSAGIRRTLERTDTDMAARSMVRTRS